MKKVHIFPELVRLSLFTVGIAAFTACSEEQILLTQDRQDGLLKINTSITQSRDVVTGTSFAEGDKIGIFVTLDGGHDYTGNSSNIDAIWQNGNWTLSRDVALMEGYPACVYAYYPYDTSTVRTNDTINIDITPDAITGQPDYMYGSDSEVTVENPTADILFRHALARVTLAVTKSATDVGNGIISQVRLENDTLYGVLNTTAGRLMKKIGKGNYISTQGKMSLADGGIKSTLNEDAYIQLPVNKTISTDEVQYIDFLVQPCGSEIQVMPTNREGGNVCVILNIDGSPYKISLGYPFWEAGQQYTYPVTIDRKTLVVPKEEPAKVGDYYYSDGTWSTYLDAGKTCVGIVFALSDTENGDIDASLQEAMHGRVVALKDFTADSWGPLGDVESIPNYTSAYAGSFQAAVLPLDGYNTYHNSFEDSGMRLFYGFEEWPATKGLDIYITDYEGLSHTQSVWKETGYPVFNSCLKQTLADSNNDYRINAWYIPAAGELARLFMAYGAKRVHHSVQSNFSNFSGEYWSSTECTSLFCEDGEMSAVTISSYSFYIGPSNYTSSGGVRYTKEKKLQVRPITSF